MRKLVWGMGAMDGVNAANAGEICRPIAGIVLLSNTDGKSVWPKNFRANKI